MSRTNPVVYDSNPATAFASFNGRDGKLGFTIPGQDGITPLPVPFTFVVVDGDTFSIGGKLSQTKDSAVFKSNYAHPNYNRVVSVWRSDAPKTIIATGTWGTVKTHPSLALAKYVQRMFIMADVPGMEGKQLVFLSLHGKAYSAWVNHTKTVDPNGPVAFQITGFKLTPSDQGSDSYVPEFKTITNVSTETLDLAARMDAEKVQPYLKAVIGN